MVTRHDGQRIDRIDRLRERFDGNLVPLLSRTVRASVQALK
jgi:hypothetical protein